MGGRIWNISDFGEETIVFKEEDVNKSMSFNFYNCEKTKIIIEGKIKSVLFSRCKKCNVTINDMISQTELLRCDAMKINVTVKCPKIDV